MKIEIAEDSVKLLPENEFERNALKNIRRRGVEKSRFQDDWEQSGYLELCHPSKDDWGR